MATTKEVEIATKSPAEFFAEHHTIAGFGTPGKSLYTTLRELVENSLDACEEISMLPTIILIKDENKIRIDYQDIQNLSNYIDDLL